MKTKMVTTKNSGLLVAAVSFFVLGACTKQIPFKEIPATQKEENVASNLLDTKATYLYSASQQNSSRSASDAFPFLSADNKRVKLEMTKDSLRIMAQEQDSRFASNETNNKLVLEIPIEHVEYRCAKDKFGECTNTEEEANDIPWDKRNTVKIKFENTKTGELDLLPIMSSQTFGEHCYTPVSERLSKAVVEKDAINFQVERTFKTNIDCLGNIDSLTDATITAIYHYSLVKLDVVASKDYKTVSYPDGSSDEQTFGFFTSHSTKLDVDNNNTDKSGVQIMNRWNPNRKVIEYHLSDEFAKPENKMVKDLTYSTIENMNKGLAEAGVQFRVHLNEPSGKIPGDIRNSMIVLVEDPVAASVIGYGPQTEDPVTGEIVSARTVMFLGTIKKYIKYTYDEIIREKLAEKLAAEKTLAADADKSKMSMASRITLSDKLSAQVARLKKTGKVFGASELTAKIKAGATKASTKSKSIAIGGNAAKAIARLKDYTVENNNQYNGKDIQSKIKYLQEAKNCAFAPAMEAAAGGISKKLMDQFPADAKPWTELSEDEKNRATAIILPEIWVPTLIHELGHNLGLRHNFAASEDKANFLNAEELQKIGADHEIPFSSVMDYGNDLKTLPVLGKYDIAALKFGYLRQVEVTNADATVSEVRPVKTTLEDMQASLKTDSLAVKDYKYCTDEHTGINAGCKRFDLGTSYTEIVRNLIADYEEAYTKRNLRDGRASMSLIDDLSYASRIDGIFKEIRIMMESKERIKYRFGLADDAAEWDQYDFLKDLKQATLEGGSFLTSVLLVPDTTCAVSLASKPNEVIAVERLSVLDPDAISCFKVQLNPNYVVVGQGGKMFNSKKDPESKNNYADQIDVRGVWLDKVRAIRNLMSREIGILSMDKNTDNFLSIGDLRTGILDTAHALMTNNVVDNVTFTLADGSKATFEINYDLGDSQKIEKSMIIDMLERQGASEATIQRYADRLGVNRQGETMLQETLAKEIVKSSVKEDKKVAAALSVMKLKSALDLNLDKTTTSVVIDDVKYVATPTNALALEAMSGISLSGTLEAVAPEKIAAILDAKLADQAMPAEGVTDAEKAVWEMPVEVLDAYLNGVIKSSDFYKKLLEILPAT